ncbi:MAG TPA: hypothetical protein VMM59_00930 [Thermohalobaculum sp.]|nr:hypothetical protein [Thermohalobaculum sp.]
MKALVLAVAALGLVAFAGTATAGCSGLMTHEQTAETPPPPPPPSPST